MPTPCSSPTHLSVPCLSAETYDASSCTTPLSHRGTHTATHTGMPLTTRASGLTSSNNDKQRLRVPSIGHDSTSHVAGLPVVCTQMPLFGREETKFQENSLSTSFQNNPPEPAARGRFSSAVETESQDERTDLHRNARRHFSSWSPKDVQDKKSQDASIGVLKRRFSMGMDFSSRSFRLSSTSRKASVQENSALTRVPSFLRSTSSASQKSESSATYKEKKVYFDKTHGHVL